MGEEPNNEAKTMENAESSFFKVNKNLVMLKLTLFFMYGATSALVPYLTIHMQSIGLTIAEIATIYLALPFTTFLGPPVTGFLVDKFGKYKPVVIIAFLLNAAIHHSFLLIPHQETPGIKPSGYVMRHPGGDIEVWWSPCLMRECPEDEELQIVLDMCVDHCLLNRVKRSIDAEEDNDEMGEEDDLTFTIGKTKKNKQDKVVNENSTALVFVLDMHPDLGDPVEQIGIEIESGEDDDSVIDYKKKFSEKLLTAKGVDFNELENEDLRCGGVVLRSNSTSEAKMVEWAEDCIVQKCNFRSGGPEVCPPDYKESDDTVFWIYFVLRFLGTIMNTACVTIMDPIALTMIEKHGGDFGREKLFSSLGMALFSPITGALIDFNSKRLGFTDYSAAFYTYDVLLVISSITVLLMPLGDKLPADNIFRDLLGIFKMPHVITFIIFLFLLGNLWGFIENFLFFYLKDLGAPNYLLGVTVTVGTISSMPFLYGAEKLTNKFGHVNIIIIAFFAHAARLMGYSFIENAWWCFPFEAMESLSVHLMWVAAATYCTILAPKHLLATLIGVIGMAHFSIGRGSGSFVGGNMIAKFGIRQAFRVMGLMAVGSGLVYGTLHYYWLRHTITDDKEDEDIESPALEKLSESGPKYKDQSTMVSFERLSLMIEMNQIGSLSSLGKRVASTSIQRARSNSIRRGSYQIGMSKSSASKVDLLKSSLDFNSRNSSTQLKNGSQKINSDKTWSAPKLSQKSSSLTHGTEEGNLIPNEADEINVNH